jgi:hypothetical protein
VAERETASSEFSSDRLLCSRPPWPGSPISTRWAASYSMPGTENCLQGGLILCHVERRLVLLDREGIAVDVRQVRLAESIGAGTVLDFPFFHAVVGEICATPVAPTRMGQSPLRPHRSGPRALFQMAVDPACVPGSRPGHDGAVHGTEQNPSMEGTCPPLTCWSTGGGETARVISPHRHQFPHSHQISRYQHIWDRGRAVGEPRVVFVDSIIRPAILCSAQPPSWKGTVTGDHQSFASVARSKAPMSSFGRGGRGGPQYPSRPNYAPRRPPGGFAARVFDGG